MSNNVVLICDDNYAMPTAVCIRSLIDNGIRGLKCVVYVCSFSLSEENRGRIESLSTNNCKVLVKLLNKADYASKIEKVSQKSHVTPSALIKFELPQIFSEIGRLLYIDSDIIIKNNIKALFDIDLSEHYLAASFELWKHLDKLYYSLNWKKHTDFFFNSGVMLLNLKKMRENGITEKLWDYKLNFAKTTLMDQESLNAICGERVYHLNIKWNFNPIFLKQNYLSIINSVYHTSYNTIDELENDVSIIHYVGKTDKPWIYNDANMGCYWQRSFRDLRWPIDLHLKNNIIDVSKDVPFWRVIIRGHGVKGFVCYIINRLLNRF